VPGRDPLTGVSVLALEFRGVSDSADFRFLTDSAGTTPIARVDPLVDHISRPHTLMEQARSLLGRQDVAPRLVLGYCASAALAARIANLAAADLVLVDPDPVTSAYVRHEFEVLSRAAGANVQDGEPLPDDANVVDLESRLLGSRARLAAAYGGDSEAFEMVDDLLGRYRAWLRFLNASADAGPTVLSGRVIVVAGKPLARLETLLAEPDRARFHRFEGRESTLANPEVRALLSRVVAGGSLSGVSAERVAPRGE
jgi:hypothetical protein